MKNENLITIEQFCAHYEIEFSFVRSLTEFGLLEITTIEETQYLPKEHIKDLEKMIRLHYDLGINLEGIEAISHLLQRVDTLQREVHTLKTRLELYEGE